MNIYFSGISGKGIAPLAIIAADAGHQVFGSDLAPDQPTASELADHDITVHYGPQTGAFLAEINQNHPIDWYVHSSAITPDNPERQLAAALNLKTTKRDALLAQIITDNNLKLIAVAGTHGKTTTTAMIIWVLQQLHIPISYSVGSNLPWGPSGHFDPAAQLFIYEADEFDRNFLSFHPYIAVITTEDYDHADIYPTPADYHQAFQQFRSQSRSVIENVTTLPQLNLIGDLRRYDATLAYYAVNELLDSSENGTEANGDQVLNYEGASQPVTTDATRTWRSLATADRPQIRSPRSQQLINILNQFPGAGRRFERLTPHIITDYAHHPAEIAATITMAREFIARHHLAGLAILYEPLQNRRQYQVRDQYATAFTGADRILWLPTYLTREDPNQPILTPEQLITKLPNPQIATPVQLNHQLAATITQLAAENYLVLCLLGGTADTWLRELVSSKK